MKSRNRKPIPKPEEKIREWYMKEFPSDELGTEISRDATFEGLFEALDHYQDVYDYLGVGDSIVRERCFSALASVMGVDYEYVYEQWCMASRYSMAKKIGEVMFA